MAASITAQASTFAGTTYTLAAATVSGDTIVPNDHGVLHVKNGSGGSINVTVAVPGNTVYGQANPDPVIAVAAGAEKIIGPFPGYMADPTDGYVHITYSAVTSVTVAYVAA